VSSQGTKASWETTWVRAALKLEILVQCLHLFAEERSLTWQAFVL